MIDYALLDKASKFYESKGYQPINPSKTGDGK
jgi:hypothetical protein